MESMRGYCGLSDENTEMKTGDEGSEKYYEEDDGKDDNKVGDVEEVKKETVDDDEKEEAVAGILWVVMRRL